MQDRRPAGRFPEWDFAFPFGLRFNGLRVIRPSGIVSGWPVFQYLFAV
jgi:hypothetical protein